MGKFVVRNGTLSGRRFRLEPGARITVGRELGDLNFPDKRMSRRHCALEARDDGDRIEDLNSTNGTFVNDERIREKILQIGDVIRVGFTQLEFLGMPEHTSMAIELEPGQPRDPSKTIAFRRSELQTARGGGAPAAVGGRSKVAAMKKAVMGLEGGAKLISAKGKFCEACGEAIFMKEGAPDEGRMLDGLYLCRMCALIAEKQRGTDRDFMPSFAKIVGGRLPGEDAGAAAGPGGAGAEIVSVEEVSLEEVTGEGAAAHEKSGTERTVKDEIKDEIKDEDESKEEPSEESPEKAEEEAEEKPGELEQKPDSKPHEPAPGEEASEEGAGTDRVEPHVGAEPEAAPARELDAEDILAAVDAAIEATGEVTADRPAARLSSPKSRQAGEDDRAAGSEDGGEPDKPGDGPILADDLRLGD